MTALFAWLEINWFNLVQSLGIIAGLVFTAYALKRDARARKASDLLELASQHRELWSEIHRRPDLGRIALTEVDLLAAPLTTAEREFMKLAINHFNTGWTLTNHDVVDLEVLKLDVRTFFSLPIPNAVWREAKAQRNPDFVSFVEEALKGNPPRSN